MSIVILPMGNRAVAPLHTLRAGTALAGLGAVLLVALCSGLALGYRFGQLDTSRLEARAAASAEASNFLDPTLPASRVLSDRVGALHGRLIRLESEALNLAKRVGVLPDTAPTEIAGEPVGGPFIALNGIAINGIGLNATTLNGAGDLATALLRLEQDLERIDATFTRVTEGAAARSLERMAFPSLLPVTGQRISSGFGKRRDPFTHRWARHSGIDIPAPRGTPIMASAGGKVVFAGYRQAYGNTVEIDHGNGLATRYAHASKLKVRHGDLVLPGQAIATVGSTGRSTGPHLHFEVLRNGVAVEPRTYLGRSGL